MSTVGFSLNKALKAQWEFGDFHALPRLYLTQGGVCRTLQTQLQVLARILHITSSRLCRRLSFGSCPAHAWDSAGKGAVRARSPPVLSMREGLRRPGSLLLPSTLPTLLVMLGRVMAVVPPLVFCGIRGILCHPVLLWILLLDFGVNISLLHLCFCSLEVKLWQT